MAEFPYDPWQKCKTISGLAADLVISALQKEIRRGHEENAATLAYEMMITSEDMEDYLWFRLRTISVEDVGFANPVAPVLIGELDQMRRVTKQPGDRGLLAIHAVRYLCKSQKDRSSDEMYNWIMKEYKAGNLRPQIPDYAKTSILFRDKRKVGMKMISTQKVPRCSRNGKAGTRPTVKEF